MNYEYNLTGYDLKWFRKDSLLLKLSFFNFRSSNHDGCEFQVPQEYTR